MDRDVRSVSQICVQLRAMHVVCCSQLMPWNVNHGVKDSLFASSGNVLLLIC